MEIRVKKNDKGRRIMKRFGRENIEVIQLPVKSIKFLHPAEIPKIKLI